MFWEKGYTPSPNIEALLEKDDVKVEELLDDDYILHECKSQKRNLMQFLTRPDVIKKLIELTITEPPEELPTAQRYKYANMACEVLTLGLPSLDEKLVGDPECLQTLYSFLEQEPPLNPLLSSFFCKTFSTLLTRKSEQDWFLYQTMCLQVLEYLKSRENFLDLIFKHFATSVIMNLLLQMIREVQGGEIKKNLYEWLVEQKLVERLINLLGQSSESDKHTNISEFISELIRNGRSMRQKEQDNDSYETSFVGTDPLLQVIEDEKTISSLLDIILSNGEVKESSIISGLNIVLTLVDASIVDEPASDKALQMIIDKEKENHEKIISTVINVVAPRLKDFHNLLINPPTKNGFIPETCSSPPFGLTRLQICRLFTVLLKTGNKDIIKEICETEFFITVLNLFKQYSWNNFLHSEVEKCLEYVFATFDQNDNEKGFNLNPSALQVFVIVNCKIVSKLIDCWMHNKNVQSSLKGHRLGYMGHLIKIFKHITSCISNSDHIGALIESNLNNDSDELNNWKLITNKEDGELIEQLEKQNKFLANCNAHETSEFTVSLPNVILPKEILFNEMSCDEISCGIDAFCDDLLANINSGKNYDYDSNYSQSENDMVLNLDRGFKVWDDTFYNNDDTFSNDDTRPLNITVNPWGNDPFSENSGNNSNNSNSSGSSSSNGTSGWADFSNFADFDAHFNSFTSDLGENCDSSNIANEENQTSQNPNPNSKALNEFNKSNNNNLNDDKNIKIINNVETNEHHDNDNNENENNDRNDDKFEIHLKNAKNLSMKLSKDDDSDDDDDDFEDAKEEQSEEIMEKIDDTGKVDSKPASDEDTYQKSSSLSSSDGDNPDDEDDDRKLEKCETFEVTEECAQLMNNVKLHENLVEKGDCEINTQKYDHEEKINESESDTNLEPSTSEKRTIASNLVLQEQKEISNDAIVEAKEIDNKEAIITEMNKSCDDQNVTTILVDNNTITKDLPYNLPIEATPLHVDDEIPPASQENGPV